MSVNYQLLFVLCFIMAVSTVSAKPENTFVEDIKLSLGYLQNEYTDCSPGKQDINTELCVSGKYDLEDITWYLDGKAIKSESKNRISYFNPSQYVSSNTISMNRVVYKAGRNKVTKKYIHKVSVVHSGGVTSWFLEQ